MSLKVIRQILESPGCAEGSDWALLIAMANRASDDGSGVWESVRSLALNAGNMGESTARKSLAKLRKAGVAVWTGKWHKNRNGQPTKIYGLDLSKIKTSQNETPQIETQVGFKSSAGGSQIERQTSPEPVQEPERENEGDPARSLAIRFWEWQGKPARYRKGSGWTERFRKLLVNSDDGDR